MKSSATLSAERASIAEQSALRWAPLVGVVAGIIALAWYLGTGIDAVPIIGSISMARAGIYLATLSSFILFAIFYRRGQDWLQVNAKHPKPKQWVYWRDTLTLSFAYAVLTLAATALLAYLLSNAFKGLELDPYTASVFVGLVAIVVSYAIINQAFRISVQSIVAVLGTILVGGVLLAMVTNNQADWWQVHFSYLGMAQSNTARLFNLTLIVSGLVLLALTDNLLNALAPAISKGETELKLNVIKGAFVFIALSLAAVGVFPYEEGTINATLHNAAAGFLVLGFLFLIGTLKWTSPDLPREFVIFSYVVAAALVACYVAFTVIGYLNLTAFELASFSLSFTWLAVYLKNLSLLAEESTHVARRRSTKTAS